MTWMTHEQSDFLKSKVDGFCLSQLQGEVAVYCTNTYREWFEKWPEIAAHFKDNAGIPLTETSGRARVTQFAKTITKIMGPSAVEHFIQMEYKDNPEVKAEIVTHMKNKSDKPHISVLRSEAAKSMAARGKDFVHHMEAEAKIECARHADQAKADLEAIRTPTENMKAHVYLGGPDPRVNGEVRVFSFHHGKGFSGFNFRDTLPDHHSRIVEPFTAFLKGAFSASHPSTNSSVTPPVGESSTSACYIDTDSPTAASHPSTNSSVTPPARESSTSACIGPENTALATPHSSTSALQGPSHDVELLDGIHHPPSVPLLDPSLLLEDLLSLDPASMDFSQVDLDLFDLPRLPSPPLSPASQGLPILPPAPQDSPITSWNRDEALGLISPPCLRRIKPKISDNPQAPRAGPLANSHLPPTPMDPGPLMSAVTSTVTVPLMPAITSTDSAHLTPAIPSTDTLAPGFTSMDTVPLTSTITPTDSTPLSPAIPSADVPASLITSTPAVPQPVSPSIDGLTESLDNTAN
ncbi:hypothetical protein P692DRAFT_20814950 [Suillus brevipes Sb2]|nr:hypothetical protein P692DRAFT_20814950 [Suillus brevipes Sb2]